MGRYTNTVQQHSRRERALEVVRRRIGFWTEQSEKGKTVTVDGKQCVPADKIAQAEEEEANLLSKL